MNHHHLYCNLSLLQARCPKCVLILEQATFLCPGPRAGATESGCVTIYPSWRWFVLILPPEGSRYIERNRLKWFQIASFSTERTNELGDCRAEETEAYMFELSPRKKYDLCEVFLQVLEGKSFQKQLPAPQYLLHCHRVLLEECWWRHF